MSIRDLQALVAKAPTPKASVKVAAKVPAIKTGVKATTPKVGVKVGAGAKVATPKVGVKVGAKVPAVKAGVKATTPKVGVKVGVKATTPKVGVKLTIPKATVKKSTVKVTVKKIIKNPTPEQWNAGTTCKPSFTVAWESVNKFMAMRDLVGKFGKGCFTAIYKLKTRLLCASCDNNAGSKLSGNAAVQTTDMADIMTQCNTWMWYVSGAKTLFQNLLTYAASVNKTAGLTTGIADLTKMPNIANKDCETLPAPKTAGTESNSLNFNESGTPVTPVKPAVKDAAKVPAVKADAPKVTAKDATKKRVLQAVAVKAPAVKASVKLPAVKAGVKVAAPKVGVKAGVKATTPKVGVKVAAPKVGVKVAAPKVGVKAGVKATTPKVGVKVGAGAKVSGKVDAKVPSIKVSTPKIKVSAPKVTLKLTLGKGENAWDSYKGVKVSTYSPTINANDACLASANMKALITGLIFSDDLTNFKNLIVPLYKAYNLAVQQIGNEKAISAWAKFKGNKGIITISVAAPGTKASVKDAAKVPAIKTGVKATTPKVGVKVGAGATVAAPKLGLKVSAKPSLKVGAKVASPKVGVKAAAPKVGVKVAAPKVGVKVAAKVPAVKAGVKVSAKKSRRMQAAAPVAPVTPVAPATPNPSSTITMSANGANLASYQNTGVSPPSFEGDGQEASGKLMRAFSLFAIMLVAIFFN